MVNEEIYVLTKHAKFEAEYIESIPIWKRRFFLHLLQKEQEEIEKVREREYNKSNMRPR